MRHRRILVVATILLLTSTAVASAGTADDPEITDPQDVDGFPAIDILGGWAVAANGTVELHLEVASLDDGPSPVTSHIYTFSFLQGTSEYHARAVADFTGSGTSVTYELRNAQGQRIAELGGEYDTTDAEIGWHIPAKLIGDPGPNATLEHLRAEGRVEGSGSVTARDRAPDSGFGEVFAFPGGTGGSGSGSVGPGPQTGPDTGASALLPALLLLGGVAVVAGALYHRRSAGPVLELTCDAPDQEARPGQGTNFPLRVENGGRERVALDMETVEVPEGWVAFIPLPTLKLDPGEARELWMTLKAPADAVPGDEVQVRVVAREQGGQLSAEAVLRADVVEATPQTAV